MQKLSALVAAARKFCVDHPSIVMGVCTAIGLALTGNIQQAVGTLGAVFVGHANNSISAMLKPR